MKKKSHSRIAAEAWEKISASIDWWTQECVEQEIIAIINSVIEKAYREGWEAGRNFAVEGQRDTATATQAESRAAHASEQERHAEID